ncbi:ATP-dependent helicase/nuclease subunit A [Candidatus Hepatincola sp. Pdp]
MNNKTTTSNFEQQIASDPTHSVWVSASAGTGKTKVLIDRLLRLLLTGVPISQILCITFTKAAAQEMINRLIDILGLWSTLNLKELKDYLRNLIGQDPTEEELTLAQGLFNILLDHPEQMKIQTIHSFCQQILAKFPIEARVPNNFTIIEETFANELKQKSLELVLTQIQDNDKENSLLNVLIHNLGRYNFEVNIKAILNLSETVSLINNTYNVKDSWHSFEEALYSYFPCSTGETEEVLLNRFFKDFPYASLKVMVETFREKNLNHKRFILENMEKILTKNTKTIDDFTLWKSVFCTKQDTPLEKFFNNEIKKHLNKVLNLANFVAEETQRILKTHEQIKLINYIKINSSFMQLAIKIHSKYQQLKEETCLLDYNDIIIKTHNLLKQTNINSWVMYKLDQRIEHILVDEAQDTNPMQWEIIKLISQEFFSGAGAKESNRTIFIVGDIKQSIYSFQGVDTEFFHNTKQYFQQQALESNKSFKQIPMVTSFRSSSGIIDFVNEVTKNIFNSSNPIYENEEFTHTSYYLNKPEHIEVWPVIANKPDEPKDTKYANLAIALSNKIKMLNQEWLIPYNDMLILYRKRENNPTLDYLVKKLKEKNIPILGLDKINLKDHIVVKDLLALASFLCQTNDDFSLACVLKSPIFNLVDDDIFTLTQYKTINKNYSLFEVLQHIPNSRYNEIYTQIQNWVTKVDYLSVFDLYFYILYKENIIVKIIKRLGLEALDPISEFMGLIMNFQQTTTDNLQSFLHFMYKNTQVITRDSSDKDSIRLLTIHGSKGLQAKVVFLITDIDTLDKSQTLIFNNDLQKPLLFLCQQHTARPKKIEELIQKKLTEQKEEAKRLLYVALTRAEEQLYICFTGKDNKLLEGQPKGNQKEIIQEGSGKNKEDESKDKKSNYLWYKYLMKSATNILTEEEDSFFSKNLNFTNSLVYKLGNLQKVQSIKMQDTKELPIPLWVNQLAPKEPYPTLPITPSQLNFEDDNFNSPLESQTITSNSNLQKGLIIHKILEQLNYVKNNHANFIDTWLNLHNLPNETKINIKNNVLNLINDPKLHYIFNSESLNEVSLSGKVVHEDQLQVISARIDKLIITNNEVLIIDYKFARQRKILPVNYYTQIQLYKKLLQQIYPKHTVRGFILFTQNPSLVEI